MKKKIYGIVGHPVKHSLSPAMQNAAFEACGIEADYTLFDVEPEGLDAFLERAAEKGIAGLNVTIPHKIKAGEYVERHGSLDENARRLGAINTIRVIDGTLGGFNTDGPGFYRSLVGDLQFAPEGKNVFVLGAGGAARAIVMYLGNGPRGIFVADADAGKAEDLASHYKRYYDERRFHIAGNAELKKILSDAELLVNATPVGMEESDPSPVDSRFLHPGLYVYDLVYNRPVTALVREANRMKLHAVTGIGMLLYQGAIAFEIWTGRKAPVEVMRRALKAALKKVEEGQG